MSGPNRYCHRRPITPRGQLRIEHLEVRDLPSFVTATSFIVGANEGGLVPQGSAPTAVAVGDFNGDGKMDVVSANERGPGVSLLLGKGNGKFMARKNLAVGPKPADILAVDVNADNRLDIVTANSGSNNVTVLRGNGDGSFKTAKHYAVGSQPAEVVAADFNADGRIDLAVANSGSNSVSLLFGAAIGGFTAGGTAVVGTNPTSVAVGDFNGDDKPDLASVSGGFGHLDINYNLGTGTFGAKVNYSTGFVATSVAVSDFNGDEIDDIAVACGFPSGDGISILIGNDNGTLQSFAEYDVGGQSPERLAIADLDGDGIRDIVTANGHFADNSVSVILGAGDGSFGKARVYAAGQGPVDVAVADFNSDGILDVITADYNGDVGTVSLLRGNGNGTLSAANNLITRSSGPIVAADMNGDGVQDLIQGRGIVGGNVLSLYPGIGNGTFGDPINSPFVPSTNSIAVGHLSNDTHLDLVATTGNGVVVLLGNGDGTFQAGASFPAGTSPKWVVTEDFNGDGKRDLAVANGTAPGVSILLGNGDGTFGAPVGVESGGAASHLVSSDFNNDGKRDLAVVHDASQEDFVSTLLGNGNGTFGAPKTYTTRVSPGAVGVGDFNGDSRPDFAIPTFFGSTLAVYRNASGGNHVKNGEYTTGSLPIGTAVADLTGDGRLDLAVVNKFSTDVYVYPGRGDGTFAKARVYVVGHSPDWIAAADFNNDGRTDLAVSNSTSGTISLLETPTPAATFRVTILPATTTAGAALKVTVSALDAHGRLATGFTGKVTLTSSDAKAVLPLPYTFTAADFGTKSFTVILKTAGTQNILVNGGALGGSDSIDVVAAAAKSFTLTAPTTTTSGAAFEVTVTARDRFGNVATGYRGTVRFTSSDKTVGVFLPPNYTFTDVDSGVKTFSVTLVKAGIQTVTVKDVLKPTILYRTASVRIG